MPRAPPWADRGHGEGSPGTVPVTQPREQRAEGVGKQDPGIAPEPQGHPGPHASAGEEASEETLSLPWTQQPTVSSRPGHQAHRWPGCCPTSEWRPAPGPAGAAGGRHGGCRESPSRALRNVGLRVFPSSETSGPRAVSAGQGQPGAAEGRPQRRRVLSFSAWGSQRPRPGQARALAVRGLQAHVRTTRPPLLPRQGWARAAGICPVSGVLCSPPPSGALAPCGP